MTPALRVPAASLLSMLCVSGALTACDGSSLADEEFSCSGLVQSISQFDGSPTPTTIRKTYPITIDFHRRGDRVMVRTSSMAVDSTVNGVQRFASASASGQINGEFDPRTGELTLLERQTLVVDGSTHHRLTSSRYSCVRTSGEARGQV